MSRVSIPWYRLPIVWLVILVPVTAIVVGVFVIWLAASSEDSLVADDYYQERLASDQDLLSDQRARETRVSAEIELDNKEGQILLSLDKGIMESYPPVMQLQLSHATRESNDKWVQMNHGQDNQYIGYISKPLSQGVWYMQLICGDWRLNARAKVKSQSRIFFKTQ